MTDIKRKKRRAKLPSSERRLDGIQAAGIVVIILVLAGLTWVLLGARAAGRAPQQWDEPPAMSIDPTRRYVATFTMENGGQFDIELRPDKAPITVNSFVFLARQGFYDGVTFHRVLDGFMAQGGDPSGTGGGGPGYEFANEDNDMRFDGAGVVAMANAGRDTNGSQFFITFGAQPELDGDYTIFGHVIGGMDVVNSLTRRDPNQDPQYPGDAIQAVTITEP